VAGCDGRAGWVMGNTMRVLRARAWAWCARASRETGGFYLMCWGSRMARVAVTVGSRAFALAFARETDGAYRVPHTTGLLHNSNTMPGTQSIYASLSILALTGLVGTGVAIGSGVSMMAMQMAEEEKKSAVVASAKETTYRPASRGFAASN